MKQIQDWLGHSDFSTTANIYAHLDYNSKLSSAQAMIEGLNFVSELELEKCSKNDQKAAINDEKDPLFSPVFSPQIGGERQKSGEFLPT